MLRNTGLQGAVTRRGTDKNKPCHAIIVYLRPRQSCPAIWRTESRNELRVQLPRARVRCSHQSTSTAGLHSSVALHILKQMTHRRPDEMLMVVDAGVVVVVEEYARHTVERFAAIIHGHVCHMSSADSVWTSFCRERKRARMCTSVRVCVCSAFV